MHLDLTVVGVDGERDVRIETPGPANGTGSAPVPFATVRPGLVAALGGPDLDLHAGPHRLRGDEQLGDVGLRTGARLALVPDAKAGRAPYQVQVLGGPTAGAVRELRRGTVVLGRDPSADLVLADERVSRRHAALTVDAGGLSVRDLESTNGTTVDGLAVPPAGTLLCPGAMLRVGDSLLVVAAPAVGAAHVEPTGGGLVVHRPPRRPTPAPQSLTVPDPPPDPARAHPVQWIGALLPAAASAGLAWFTHSWLFLTFGLLTPLMVLSSALGDRVHWRRARRLAARERRRTGAVAAEVLAAALHTETRRRRDEHPDPPFVAAVARTPGTRIWERRPGHADWLTVRVGCGAARAELTVTAASGGTSATTPAGTVDPVPLRLPLAGRTVGLAGPEPGVRGLARWLVAQLATWHSPDDLEIVLLLDRASAAAWRWARWLPHVRVATTESDAIRLASDLAGSGSAATRACVVLVDRRAGVPSELAVHTGQSPGPGQAGTPGPPPVAVVVLAGEARALPAGCRAVVELASDGTATVRDSDGHDDTVRLTVDSVTEAWCDPLARALAPLSLAGPASARPTPARCSLLDCAGVDDLSPGAVAARWAVSSGRPDTVLGRAGDAAFRVDLAFDGPHALVAGTTGSGKSRLLQTLVAGLALDHPPTEVTFLLIDFKGGAAFAACAELPHCAGLVTDLDAWSTQRALRSLDAELRHRERLLLAAGAPDLDAYRAGPGTPVLARLIIVVDEFAALAEELPDFVPGLVGIANRGRSLGIHLVLATQRPGSIVSAQIRANTSLRIALRVADPTESTDVVGTPAAAGIPVATPGRAVVRTADGCTEVQVAEADGHLLPTPGTVRVHRLDEWRRPVTGAAAAPAWTPLADVVAALRVAADTLDLAAATPPWRPELPDRLPLPQLAAGGAPAVVIGRRDDPDRQAQPPLAVDLAAGESVLLLGGPRSGRTTALATLSVVAAGHPDRTPLELHLVSADGRLAALLRDLPGVSSVLGPGDLAGTVTLLDRLASTPPTPGTSRLILLDGWESVLGELDDLAALHAGTQLAALLRAPGHGAVAATGDRSLLAPRFTGQFTHRWALRFADPADVAALGIRTAPPYRQPPGRGLAAADGLPFQLAVPGPAGLPVEDALRGAVAGLTQRAAPAGPASVRVRGLPHPVPLATLPVPPGRHLRVGRGGDAAEPVTLDPFAGGRRWLVTGPARSGRTSTLVTLYDEARRCGIPVVVAAPPRSDLVERAARAGAPLVLPHTADVGERPGTATLLLIDDAEAFADTAAGDALLSWVSATDGPPLAVVLAGRGDDLAVAYRGLAADVRRSRAGIALRPEPVDAEVFGIRLPRASPADPPGRGRLLADPAWTVDGRAVAMVGAPLQVAQPTVMQRAVMPAQSEAAPIWGYR